MSNNHAKESQTGVACCGLEVRRDYEVVDKDTLRCPTCGNTFTRLPQSEVTNHARGNEGESKPDEQEPRVDVWYHFLAKGWECPGHDDNYQSSSCIGAIYVGHG